MEPVTMMAAAVAFCAAQVFQKCADEATDAVWLRITALYKKVRGHEPTPDEVVHMRVEPEVLASVDLSVVESTPVLRRAQAVAHVIDGAKFLWIDDNPQNNAWERTMFEVFGARIVSVQDTDAAVACAGVEPFDLVISDIARGERPHEGIAAMPALQQQTKAPVIFYAGRLQRGTDRPNGSFGITNRPDELLHLTLDVLERTRI